MSQAAALEMNLALLIGVVVTGNTGTDAQEQSSLCLSLGNPRFNVRENVLKGFSTEAPKLFDFENETQWGGEKDTPQNIDSI